MSNVDFSIWVKGTFITYLTRNNLAYKVQWDGHSIKHAMFSLHTQLTTRTKKPDWPYIFIIDLPRSMTEGVRNFPELITLCEELKNGNIESSHYRTVQKCN